MKGHMIGFIGLLGFAISVHANNWDSLTNTLEKLKITIEKNLTQHTKEISASITSAGHAIPNLESTIRAITTSTENLKHQWIPKFNEAKKKFETAQVVADMLNSFIAPLTSAYETLNTKIEKFVRPFVSKEHYDHLRQNTNQLATTIQKYSEEVSKLVEISKNLEKKDVF
jgi:hypothetical protein